MKLSYSKSISLPQSLLRKVLLSFLATIFIASCMKEDSKNFSNDALVSNRILLNCDGTPMLPPVILDSWTEDGVCCFELEFSKVYLDGSVVQIIGFDSSGNTMALQPNGYCLGNIMNYKYICCINDTAATITISLFPSNKCIEIPLPCT